MGKKFLEWVTFYMLIQFHLSLGQNTTENPQTDDSTGRSREGKFISMFQVIKFPNDPCTGSGTRNGTCYTSTECSSKSGLASGTCASGFGVCCSFVLGCGQTSSQNGSYFESTGSSGGICKAAICKVNSDICQLRLDFVSFVISGPSTLTTTNVLAFFGEVSDKGTAVSSGSQCLTDSFAVTGSSNVPVLCGRLTGDHIYVDANPNCNTLNFNLGAVGIGTIVAARTWQIRVTQYSCDFPNKAPSGCLQYFFGTSTGIVNSFNFNGSPQYHLANQQQTICIRRERGFCKICYSTAEKTDFQLSGKTTDLKGIIAASQCCGYKGTGKGTLYDCLIIPGAETAKNPGLMLSPSYCGRSAGLVSISMGIAATTICSKRTPFKLSFYSDNWENTAPAGMGEAKKSAGFKLSFFQATC